MLNPQEYRLREPLDVLGEPGLVKLAGTDTGNAVAMVHLTVPKLWQRQPRINRKLQAIASWP